MSAASNVPDGWKTIAKAFSLLERLADSPREMNLTELASATDLTLPTTHRLLRALMESGYVRQIRERRYVLGPRLIRLGERATAQLGATIRPFLTSLVDEVRETVNFSALDGNEVIYLAEAPWRQPVRLFTEVGRRVDLHCTAAGKVLLAQLNEGAVVDIVRQTGMPAYTPKTITDLDVLRAELDTVRANGYAVNEEEYELGRRCVAVSVAETPTYTAISVSGPTCRMSPNVVESIVPMMQQTAKAFARTLVASRDTRSTA